MAFRFPVLAARRALAVAALAGLTMVAACGGDDSTGPSGDTYAMFSIDGQTLPIVEDDGAGNVYTLKSGSISLLANGTYTFRQTETYKPSGEPLETFVSGENGTYVISGSTLTTTSTHDFEDGVLTVVGTPEVTTATKTATQITAAVDDGGGGTITVIFKK